MCHNCHLVIVDTRSNITTANKMNVEIDSLLGLKFVNQNTKTTNTLEDVKSKINSFIKEMENMNGTQGTSDVILKLNAEFNETIKTLNMLKMQHSYSNLASNYMDEQDGKIEWLIKKSQEIDSTLFSNIVNKLDVITPESFNQEHNKFLDAELFKKSFRDMKIQYTRTINEKGLWKDQMNSFVTQIMGAKTLEEYNGIISFVESRAIMNRRLESEMQNVIDGIKQVGMQVTVDQHKIIHEESTNVSKILFKLKKKHNDDTVEFTIDDRGNTRYVLGDYHTTDYQGEDALEREEKDLEQIQTDLLKAGFIQSQPSFQSAYGFHSNKSFKLKEMEMK